MLIAILPSLAHFSKSLRGSSIVNLVNNLLYKQYIVLSELYVSIINNIVASVVSYLEEKNRRNLPGSRITPDLS